MCFSFLIPRQATATSFAMILQPLIVYSQGCATTMARCESPQPQDTQYSLLHMQGLPPKPSYPSSIADLTIIAVRDLTIGYDSSNPPTYKPTLPLSSGHMVQFRAENPNDGTKISLTIRTSGTEPKVIPLDSFRDKYSDQTTCRSSIIWRGVAKTQPP